MITNKAFDIIKYSDELDVIEQELLKYYKDYSNSHDIEDAYYYDIASELYAIVCKVGSYSQLRRMLSSMLISITMYNEMSLVTNDHYFGLKYKLFSKMYNRLQAFM